MQESLTNVIKHAGPAARARVGITYGHDALRVEVADDGRGAPTGADAVPGDAGHGIIGMRERVATCGGTLDVGPRPGGGHLVAATIPLTPTDKDPR